MIGDVPESPHDAETLVSGDVEVLDGAGEPYVDDNTLFVPEFIASRYGWWCLHYADYTPASNSGKKNIGLVYGETLRLRLVRSADGYMIAIDIEFDDTRDGQRWERIRREEYLDFADALERYIKVAREGIIGGALVVD